MTRNERAWVKSSFCTANGSCVEVLSEPDCVTVRNTEKPNGPAVQFTSSEWEVFLAGVRNGEFGAV